MIKSILLVIAILFLVFSASGSKLLTLYQKGVLKLTADDSYGKGNDWETLFLHAGKNLAITSDGFVFISCPAKGAVLKFNPDGLLVGTYGQTGEGPGDLFSPGNISILDGKYLVIGEAPERRRISLFDFSGKPAFILKTSTLCFSVIALKNNRIAYLTLKRNPVKIPNKFNMLVSVIIQNILNGKELEIAAYDFILSGIALKSGGMFSCRPLNGEALISRTPDGNLLTGFSGSKKIRVFSPDGKLLNHFTLQMEDVPVTEAMIENEKKEKLISLKDNPNTDASFLKEISAYNFGLLFGKICPYYQHIMTDSDGNILVFKWIDAGRLQKKVFQVYAPSGKLICETAIDEGDFIFQIDSASRNLQFCRDNLYIIEAMRNPPSGEDTLRLAKIVLR